MIRRLKTLLPGVAILLGAAAVRLPALAAGWPYTSYVDEGHVLHHVVHLLAARTWEPDTYSYPTLPFYLITGAALAYSPVYPAVHGHALREGLSPSPYQYYDLVEPAELIIIGRLITLVFSLGVVVLTGLLARRLAGPAAGLFAAGLAALVPALVVRSSIVNINPMMTFFVVAALFFAEGARDGNRPRRDAALAGAMAGLAGATKYPAALVCAAIALAILLADAPWRERLNRLLLAAGCTAATLLLAMPALWLRTRNVLAGLRTMSDVYGVQEIGSYWDQAVHRAEWDLPLEHPELGIAFLLLAAGGALVALRDDRWSRPVLAWLLFGAAMGYLMTSYKFRAFRNLLALVPLACATASLLYARVRRSVRHPLAVDLAAAVLPVFLFAPALCSYVRFQVHLEDSREQAIHWLDEHAGPGDRVLFAEELATLPARIASLRVGETDVQPWSRARDRIFRRRFHYVVLGELTRRRGGPKIPLQARRWILSNYTIVAKFGQGQTPPAGWIFHGNRQTIYILKRVPREGGDFTRKRLPS